MALSGGSWKMARLKFNSCGRKFSVEWSQDLRREMLGVKERRAGSSKFPTNQPRHFGRSQLLRE